jgi:hypothetical protein
MGKVDGVEEFRVAWAQTWMPESDSGGARKLVEEFKARFSVGHGKKNGQAETDVAGESLPKRRRDDLGSDYEVNLSWQGRFPFEYFQSGLVTSTI